MNFTPQTGRLPGGDVLRSTLVQIPTAFGRLVYLSSLRNPASGRFEHEQLSRQVGSEAADYALCNKHREAFSEWLERSLEDQKDDLVEYLAGVKADPRRVAQLEHVAPYRDLIPASAREVERQLYLTDIETLIDLLRFERECESWG